VNGIPAAQVEDAARAAMAHYSRGNFALAEVICRDILDVAPNFAGAFNLIGAIAAQLGLRDEAIWYFTEALQHAPDYAGARDNLALAKAMKAPELSRGERFLLIKAWGAGFWSDVSSVLGALLLAEITGRIPVTHWGANSLFGEDSASDAFGHYFEPLSAFDTDALKAMKASTFFPPKWSADNFGSDNIAKWQGIGSRMGGIYYLNRAESIAVVDYFIAAVTLLPWIPSSHSFSGETIDGVLRLLAEKYLKPRMRIVGEVDKFYHRHIAGHPTIAVHVRGSDKGTEIVGLDALNRSYFDILDAEDIAFQFFLMTDDARWAAAFKERYGNRVVMTESERTDGNRALHALAHEDRVRLGTEVMVDTYLALRCDKFLGNGRSNVSAMSAILKRWPEGSCALVAPSLLHERDDLIYTSDFGTRR